jgi:NitT/TauT family transport system substrate-binding protein
MKARELVIKIFVCLLTLFSSVAVAGAQRVKVGIPAHSITNIAFYAGISKGYYREEGLEVELVLMRSPVANIAQIAGEVEFTAVPSAALGAALRGAPLRILSTTFYRPLFWLYAKPDIRDLKDLKGKKIGFSGIGSADDVLMEVFFRKNGLVPGRDFPLLSVGDTSSRFTALVSGSIDAATLAIEWSLKAKEAGFRELISFVKEDLVLLLGSIVVHESLLQSNPTLVEKFTRGTIKGLFFARDNRPGAISILARSVKVKEDLATEIFDLARPAMAADGTVSEEPQKRYVELIARIRGVNEPPSFERFFNFSLTRKIVAQLNAAGWRSEP